MGKGRGGKGRGSGLAVLLAVLLFLAGGRRDFIPCE